MIYVIKQNNELKKVPYTGLKAAFPNFSFPKDPKHFDASVLSNVYKYSNGTRFKVEENTHINIATEMVLEGDTYVQQYKIEPLPLEQASENQRAKRDELIRETDWRFMIDQNPSQEWRDYRQALRNVPQQPGFPYSVDWPTQPGE